MKTNISDQFLNGTYLYCRMMGFEFESKNPWLKMIFIIGLTNEIFVVFGQIAYFFFIDIELNQRLEMLLFINYYVVSFAKISSLLYYRKAIVGVIQEFYDKSPSEELIKAYNLKIHVKQYKFVETILIVFFWNVLVFNCCQPLIASFIDLVKNGEFTFRLLWLVYYGIEIPYGNVTYYTIMYTSQVLSVYMSASIFLGMDLCTFSSIMQLNMQFDITCKNIIAIEPDDTDEGAKRLIDEIRVHQQFIGLAARLNTMLTPSVTFNLFSSSLIICFTGYQLLGELSFFIVAKAVFLLGYELKQVAITCYFADKLIDNSLKVSDAVYEHKWYDGNQKYKRLVLILLMRSQKCVTLSISGITEISLQTFRQVLSMSYQVFTVLRSR